MAPKVTIDFGDGRVLERTLVGNIATWFVTPDGRAVDVLAGLVHPVEYTTRLKAAAELVNGLPRGQAERLAAVRSRHAESLGLGLLGAQIASPFSPTVEPELLAMTPPPVPLLIDLSFASKGFIEDPIKLALRQANRSRRRLEGRVLGLMDPMESLLLDTQFTKQYRDPVVHKHFQGLPDSASGQPITEGDLLGVTFFPALGPLPVPGIVNAGGPGLGPNLHRRWTLSSRGAG